MTPAEIKSLNDEPVIEILIIGNEILSGRTRDKNASYMIERLRKAGFSTNYISVVGDTLSHLAGAFRTAAARSDIVFATGGLGPTSDDMTVQALAETFGCELILDENVLKHIEALFRRRNRIMSDSNKKQAYIPDGAVSIENAIGTAPGVLFEKDGCSIFLMPGVPHEMQKMFARMILPRVMQSYSPVPSDTATVSVSGISESELYDRIGNLPGARDAFFYYPGPDGIVVSIIAGKDAPLGAGVLRDKVVELLGDHVFSTQGESIEEVAGELLTRGRLTVGVAESCTGGLVTDRLTNVPGSSAYLLAGVVAYSNESKHVLLGVDNDLIMQYGAVSAEVAGAMAEGIRRVAGADIGISTTGIAGPAGGSAEKPVGLMYTGISSSSGTDIKKLQFVENRLINKRRMSHTVLNILRLHLKKRFEGP